MLTIRQEREIDFEQTAALACEGFGMPAGSFTAPGLRWLYEQAFSGGTSLFAAYADERKVGQVALVHQAIDVAGRTEAAVALVDLFILKAFRSRDAIAALYGAVEAFCEARAIRFILAVPNEKAAGVNVRYLKLAPLAALDIRAGFGWLPLGTRGIMSCRVSGTGAAEGKAILSRYCGRAGTGLHWTPDGLWGRLQKPGGDYVIHAGENAVLVSALRTGRRMRHVLLCAFLVRPGAVARRWEAATLAAAACRLHRTPLFVYVGLNHALQPPGALLPKRLRPSQMVLQLRDVRPGGGTPVTFDRFEALDFDFA